MDKDGNLWLNRNGKLKQQFCLYDKTRPCGENCVGFSETVGEYYVSRDEGRKKDYVFCSCLGQIGDTCKEDNFLDERRE